MVTYANRLNDCKSLKRIILCKFYTLCFHVMEQNWLSGRNAFDKGEFFLLTSWS